MLDSPTALPRHLAVGILCFTGTLSAVNHVAARVAFDDGAGVLLAVLCRSGLSGLALFCIVLWRQLPLRLPAGLGRWQLAVGLLVALQSLCLYSAVSRIPVAVALLLGNLFPFMLVLLTWALGGKAPTRLTGFLMVAIVLGLVLVLDLPAVLGAETDMGPEWSIGILFALGGSSVFTVALWITDHRLSSLAGPVRGMYTIITVFVSTMVVGVAEVLPQSLHSPGSWVGWTALATLSLLYATTFSILFILMPRLDMARNAPVMNIEPVASLVLGAWILGQYLNGWQLLGGAVVLGSIVALAYSKRQ